MKVLEKEVADKEFLGRYKFEQFCRAQSWCTLNKFSYKENAVWDVAYWSAGTAMIGEIKVRNYNSNEYDDWFMELSKRESLKDLKYLYGIDIKTKLTYINFYNNDDAVRIWDITHNTTPPYTKTLQKNDTYGDEVEKLVFDLKNEDAVFELTGETVERQIQKRLEEIKKNKQNKR